MKTCTLCGEHKRNEEFSPRKWRAAGSLASHCKACKAKTKRELHDGLDAHRLRAKYGITVDQYEAKFLEQDGRCAICKGESNGRGRLHVDHNHRTMKFRGLLCFRCNTSLGLLKEHPETLKEVSNYLFPQGSDEHLLSLIYSTQ